MLLGVQHSASHTFVQQPLFLDNLGKLVPEWQTILDFNAADDLVAMIQARTLCKAAVKSSPREYTQFLQVRCPCC